MIVRRQNVGQGRRIDGDRALGWPARVGKFLRLGLATLMLGVLAAGCVSHTDLTDLTPDQRRKRLAAVRPDWTQHFEDMSKGAILISIQGRWLVYWEPGGARSHAFPIAVPLNDSLTKTGITKVVRRRELPTWTATPDMIERNPEVPRFIGAGPHNPLGEHALYLGWRYYAIHGTNTPGQIGDRATSGCFRLFSEDIKFLFDNVALETPVKVIYSTEVEAVPLSATGQSDGSEDASQPQQQPGADAVSSDPNAPVQSTPILDDPSSAGASQRTAPSAYPPLPPDGRIISTPILDNPPASQEQRPVSEDRQPPAPIGFNRG